ncbi:hypothetical protein JOQ06_020374, partial [Pogonophryne albipinna]
DPGWAKKHELSKGIISATPMEAVKLSHRSKRFPADPQSFKAGVLSCCNAATSAQTDLLKQDDITLAHSAPSHPPGQAPGSSETGALAQNDRFPPTAPAKFQDLITENYILLNPSPRLEAVPLWREA